MKLKNVLIVSVLLLMLTSCFPQRRTDSDDHRAGVFTGIWHGWIAPVSLVAGFFDSDITIYEKHNTGWWYDLGFYAAIISGFGGLSVFRSKNKD